MSGLENKSRDSASRKQLNKYYAFEDKVLNNEASIIINAYSNREVSKEEIARVSSTIQEEKVLDKNKYFALNKKLCINDLQLSNCLFFIEEAQNVNNSLIKKYGLIFSNSSNAIEDFDRLTFHQEYHKNIGIIPSYGKLKEPYDYKKLREYFLPNNEIVLIDPYLTHWNESMIKENFIDYIQNLFLNEEILNETPIRLKIISVYEKSYETINTHSKTKTQLFGKNKIEKIGGLAQALKKYLHKYNIYYSITYINEYVIKADKDKEGEKKSELEYLFEIVDGYFHDRFHFSTYLLAYSGRSLDYNSYDKYSKRNVLKRETNLALSSLLITDNLKRVFEHRKRIKELEDLIQNPEYKQKYFHYKDGKTNE